MTVARFALRCNDVFRQGTDPSRSLATGVRPVATGHEFDRSAVTFLARECAASADGAAVGPAGLWGELQGRPGKTVHAWLAEAGPDAIVPRTCPEGLVSLVVSGDGGRRRFSVAWLVVHPLARRQGLGRLLVGIAVMHARSLGAERVHADTLASWPAAVAFWHAVGFERLA